MKISDIVFENNFYQNKLGNFSDYKIILFNYGEDVKMSRKIILT